MRTGIMLLRDLYEPPSDDYQPLLEFMGNPDAPVFEPTPKFKQFYGNYCGPGNRGGEPIDDIDAACQQHDMCYHYNQRHDQKCDARFIRELRRLLLTKLTFKQRYHATIMYRYFLNRMRKRGIDLNRER